jgi:hypothetical protein
MVSGEPVYASAAHGKEINLMLQSLKSIPRSNPLAKKIHIDLLKIRPDESLDIDIETFNTVKIEQVCKKGWDLSRESRRGLSWL